MGNERFWLRTTRVTLIIVSVLFGILAVTGIVLVFQYQPDIKGVRTDRVRTVHQAATYLFMLSGIVLALSSITLFGIRRRWVLGVFPVLTGVLAIAAVLTGSVLPWDQLSLRVVTIGQGTPNYWDIVHSNLVKDVLIGNSEIPISTFRATFWIHAVLLPLVIAYLLFLIARGVQRGLKQPGGGEVGTRA